MNAIEKFWASQTQSLNRESHGEFYRRKALEHAGILGERCRSCDGVLDIACGAGELLEQLAGRVRIEVGLDYSESMLAAARQRLGAASGIEWVRADVFEYLPAARTGVWMSTGGINQYLDAADLRRILDIFAGNPHARALYLFDCIDPLRLRLLQGGISYRPEHLLPDSPGWRARRLIRRLRFATRYVAGGYAREVQYLGSPSMGYGQLPAYWLRECAARLLQVEIVSSRYYEYRYHACITKDA